MRDYRFRCGAGELRFVAEQPTEILTHAIAYIRAGKFTRESDDDPMPDALLERLQIELLARGLGL